MTITNEKDRLSQEEIDQMVKEALEFAEEDKKVKERIIARNSLETYVYNMNQVSDNNKLSDKLEADEKEKIEAATKEALEWLDEKEDYEVKLVEAPDNRHHLGYEDEYHKLVRINSSGEEGDISGDDHDRERDGNSKKGTYGKCETHARIRSAYL